MSVTINDIGKFAYSPKDTYQLVGKVQAVNHHSAQLSIFRSPIKEGIFETINIPKKDLAVYQIPCQSLIYLRRDGSYFLGRVVSNINDGVIHIKLPNSSAPIQVDIDNIFIRIPASDDDPTDLLAAQITNSPYFKKARTDLIRFVDQQRSDYRSLTALSTARVQVYDHQIRAVRRVLHDPIQRYLLADEVGLGKTIEACLLISQHLIDERETASVVIIVPDHLVDQWATELYQTFGIRSTDSRINLISYTDLDQLDISLLPTFTLIDEAHQTCQWAFPTEVHHVDSERLRDRYQKVERLAQASKLLLLSGTPVLHNEDGFLSMLHLLEPHTYRLDDLDGFRKRLEVRPHIANALSNLSPSNYDPHFIEDDLNNLMNHLPDDDEVKRLIENIKGALQKSDHLDELLSHLCSYLLERYKLHRRIIRTHRDSPQIAEELPTRCGIQFYGHNHDVNREYATSFLDEWRHGVLQHNPEPGEEHIRVFATFINALLCHPRELGRIFQKRASALRQTQGLNFFDQEVTLLEHSAESLLEQNQDARTDALIEKLRQTDINRRVVIFIDAPEEANHIVNILKGIPQFQQRVQRLEGVVTELASGKILICDRHAEEGMNLQRCHKDIIFHDLPFDTARLEQRIGRFDRLEGMSRLEFWIPRPVSSYESSWVNFLKQLSIFTKTTARLQYFLADVMEKLKMELFTYGPQEAFVRISQQYPSEVFEKENEKLKRQELFETTEWTDEELNSSNLDIDDIRDRSIDEGGRALHGWFRCINIRSHEHELRPNEIRFSISSNDINSPPTLIPSLYELSEDQCEQVTIEDETFYGPFALNDDANCAMLGIANPFFDVIYQRMRRDDRSRSWAMWRLHESYETPSVYICFSFTIEANLNKIHQGLSQFISPSTLRRLVDDFFPVEHKTIWFDLEQQVVDDTLLEILMRPYQNNDQNLNHSRWVQANQYLIDEILDWSAHISHLRNKLEIMLRNDPEIERRSKRAQQRIDDRYRHHENILRSRMLYALDNEREAINQTLRNEKDLKDVLTHYVEQWKVSIDNVGAVILSQSPL